MKRTSWSSRKFEGVSVPQCASSNLPEVPYSELRISGSLCEWSARRERYPNNERHTQFHCERFTPRRTPSPEIALISPQRLQGRPARIFSLRAQFLLDAQQLVVLRSAVGARQRSGLDLTAIGGDREVGDGGILGLAGTVRHHGGVAGLIGHLDRAQRFGQRADLVDL